MSGEVSDGEQPAAGSGHCLSCAIVAGQTKTTGGTLFETAHFHAHQDFAYPIPGLVIVALKRHARALDELTDVEVVELARVLRRLRRAQREALAIEYVYYLQRRHEPSLSCLDSSPL